MSSTFIDLLKSGNTIVYDGALGTQIQKSENAQKLIIQCGGCNEMLNIVGPDTIVDIHLDYFRAGAQIIETNTFGGNRPKLDEYSLGYRVYEINKAGASTARRAVELFGGERPLFVAGSIGPTGFLPSSQNENLSKTGFDELVVVYQEQAEGLLDGGIDVALFETGQDLLEIRAAIIGIRQAFETTGRSVPIQIQVTIDAQGRMLLGSTIDAFLGAVGNLGVDVVGLNCGMGPVEMKPYIEQLLKKSATFVSMLPNAGMPQNIDGKAVYPMHADEFADHVEEIVFSKGLQIVGGCCGTTPEHIASVTSRIKNRTTTTTIQKKKSCFCGTGIGGSDLETGKRPLIIGERLNTQGSKKTRELVLARNYDELTQIALDQVEKGSALLDICVAVNEQDSEPETMSHMVKYLRERVDIPLCIDTTELDVMNAALSASPGSVMLNSINLEQGGTKARHVLSLAKKFGCPVVALTIDDSGMAKTIEQKVSLAKKIRDIACNEYGLQEHFIYIDPLVFTLATGERDTADAAVISLAAIKAIKSEMPGIRTVMGVSNVSYGLSPNARRILNNVMLHHAVQAGLDAAIFNPLHIDDITRYDETIRNAAENLLFNRTPDALTVYIDVFEQKVSQKVDKKDTRDIKQLSPEQQLRNAILKRNRKNLIETIHTLLKSTSAIDILNTILLPAMNDVGEKMSKGEIILPFVLQSAEIMKESVVILEPYLKDAGASSKGKILLATVYGDVHDIGKNLVGSILKNQGYQVIDLGKQVPVETIIEMVKSERPDAIGLSALLVTTSKQMALCVGACAKNNLSIPIIIGGAAVNREYASRISILENGEPYTGGVFFAKDAFEASKYLEKFSSHNGNPPGPSVVCENQSENVRLPRNVEPVDPGEYMEPPFWGTSSVLTWDNAAILKSIHKVRLFKGEWAGGNLDPKMYDDTVKNDFEPMFTALEKEIIEEELFHAAGLYAFFPVIIENEQMIILDPSDFHTELATFAFPRMKTSGRSLCDYYRADCDIVAFQVVTIGKKAGDKCRHLIKECNLYSKGFFLNALANHCTEYIADKVTSEIRRCFGCGSTQGRRYSFGYPGMPSLEHQLSLFELLSVEERLDIQLTDAFQMVPEHSTMGLFVQNPNAEFLK